MNRRNHPPDWGAPALIGPLVAVGIPSVIALMAVPRGHHLRARLPDQA